MPLRPNQTFALTVAFTAVALTAEFGLMWKLGLEQDRKAALLAATSPPLGPAATPVPAPLFVVPGGGTAPQSPVLPGGRAPGLVPPANASAPGAALPPDKKALAKSYFEAATAALSRKDQKTALENFLKVVEIAPDHLATRLNLAVLYLGAKQPENALPQLQKAAEIAPKNPATQFEMARTLLSLGRPIDAIAPLRKAIQLAPKEHASTELLAQIYLAQKKPLEAYRLWSALAKAQPADTDAALQAAGLAADALRRPAEAEKWLRTAARQSPKDVRPSIMLGRLLMAERKPKAAAQILGAAAKARPDVFEIYTTLADARMASGDLSGAQDALKSALLRVPVPKTPEQEKGVAQLEGSLHFSLGRVLGQSKKPKEALAEFRRADALIPGQAENKSLIGLAQVQTGNRKGAIASIQAALKLDPKRANDRRLLAQLFEQTGNWAGANEQFQQYNALQPRDGAALVDWALAARRAKKTDQELKIWSKLAAADPKNPFPYLQSGVTLREAKRPTEALASFQRAVALSPKNVDALFEIAKLQTQLKQSGNATDTWKQVISLQPGYTPAYSALLSSSAKSGDNSSTRIFLAKELAGDENPKALSEVLRYYESTKNEAEAKALLSDVVKRNPKARAAKAALDSYQPAASAVAETKATAAPASASPSVSPPQ